MFCDRPKHSLCPPRDAGPESAAPRWAHRGGAGSQPYGDDMIKSMVSCECGGQPTAKSLSYLRGRWFWVHCSSCQARSADRKTLDEAVADWNQRVKRTQAEARQPRAKIRRQA